MLEIEKMGNVEMVMFMLWKNIMIVDEWKYVMNVETGIGCNVVHNYSIFREYSEVLVSNALHRRTVLVRLLLLL